MLMTRNLDMQRWAQSTCHDICNASDLKQLCRARGFAPPKLSGKGALAEFVEMRLLGPDGVKEALATLDENALWALHFVRCAGEPINAMKLQSYFGFKQNAYSAPDFKVRFERIQKELISKGLLLAYDTRAVGESRFERMEILLPPAVAEALPPLPVESEPVDPPPAFRDWTEAAVEFMRADLLAPQDAGVRNAAPSWSRLFPVAKIEKGVLQVKQQERPAPASLRSAIFKNWLGIRSAKRQSGYHAEAEVLLDLNDESVWRAQSIITQFIRPRDYILNAIPAGHGIRFARLFEAFKRFQCSVSEDIQADFLASGERLGFLAVSGIGDQRLLVPNPQAKDTESAPTFAHWNDADTMVTASLPAVTLVELLTIARISQLSIKANELHATPSLKWIGRERASLQESGAFQALLRHSTLYRQAFASVAVREGKWVVHSNITALKLGGSDIEAVLLAEYGPDGKTPRLAALGTGWYAICRNDLEELLAFVKKKGFKPKITAQSSCNEGNDTEQETHK